MNKKLTILQTGDKGVQFGEACLENQGIDEQQKVYGYYDVRAVERALVRAHQERTGGDYYLDENER